MDNKEKWIEDIIAIAPTVKMVEVPETLAENILNRLPARERQIITLQPFTKWTIAASVALLIAFNSFTLIRFAGGKMESSEEKQGNTVYTAYFSFMNQE